MPCLQAFEASLALRLERTPAHFRVDAGSLRTMASAGKWCRDSPLRPRLISLLRSSKSFGGCEASWIWADTLQTLNNLEGLDIQPPLLVAADVPEYRRVRLHAIAFYWKAGLQRLDYPRYPYSGLPESVWLEYRSKFDYQLVDNAEGAFESQPDFTFGPGYLYFPEADGSHHTI